MNNLSEAELSEHLTGEETLSPEELIHGAKKKGLGPWYATSICGNDITSSCLYVSAISIVYAHALAPLALLLVAAVLYLYRKIYTEVVEALPLDGGVYNCLLNSTRKFDAGFAACLSLLAYLATAVVSAKTSVEYLRDLVPFLPSLETTSGVIIIFAILTIMGIKDSARVALVIFLLHIVTLTIFVFASLWVMFVHHVPLNMVNNWNSLFHQGNWLKSLFLGFSAAMLGVSGFETSANYVEQQQSGVFRLTLRNMWLAVAIFNPLIALLALNLMPEAQIIQAKDDLLSQLGLMVGNHPLETLIDLDACLVLSGAVLTSYVGVSGLVHRMTLDQCFPQIILKSTRRGSYPWISLGFMTLCISILYLTQGNLLSLAGVYTISFLSVMTAFAIGNILIKVNRKELKRTYIASWTTVIIAASATVAGIIGNLIIDYRFLWYFAIYFIPAVTGGILMYLRIPILKGTLIFIDKVLARFSMWRQGVDIKIEEITNVRVVLFVRLGHLNRLLRAFNYINKNEVSNNVLVLRYYVHDDPLIEGQLQKNLNAIRELFPDMKIEYQAREGKFSPKTVDHLSKEIAVPKNMMFMGSLTEKQIFSVQELGGVRIIF